MMAIPKEWRDYPDTSTPITASSLVDLETRLSRHTDATAEQARRRDRAWRALAPAGSGVGVTQVSSDRLSILGNVGGQRWFQVDLAAITYAGHAGRHIDTMWMSSPMVTVDESAGTFTGTWVTGTAAAAYGGGYRHSNGVSGLTCSWTSPAATTRLGVRVVATSNAGICVVTVSGGQVANLLPTAAQAVAAGEIPASALVANGGTLDPSDRVINQYRGTPDWDRHFPVADGLPPAAYTVTIRSTSYKAAAASAARAYISGFTSGSPSTTPQTPGAQMLKMSGVFTQGFSAFEFAIEWTPSDAAHRQFMGSVHGNEVVSSLLVGVDGAPAALTDGQSQWGDSVEVSRVSTLRHPAVGGGATVVADVVTTYRMTRDGLNVAWRATWRQAGNASRAYAAMFPADGWRFTRGSVAGDSVDHDLTLNGDQSYGHLPSDGAYMWDGGGGLGVGMMLDDFGGVDGWSAAGGLDLWIQDRNPASGLDVSKVYATRAALPAGQQTASGDVWSSSATYRAQMFRAAGEALGR